MEGVRSNVKEKVRKTIEKEAQESKTVPRWKFNRKVEEVAGLAAISWAQNLTNDAKLFSVTDSLSLELYCVAPAGLYRLRMYTTSGASCKRTSASVAEP